MDSTAGTLIIYTGYVLNRSRCTINVQLRCWHMLLNSQLFKHTHTHTAQPYYPFRNTRSPSTRDTSALIRTGLEKAWNLNYYQVRHRHSRSTSLYKVSVQRRTTLQAYWLFTINLFWSFPLIKSNVFHALMFLYSYKRQLSEAIHKIALVCRTRRF
jgi:hypothetical protein